MALLLQQQALDTMLTQLTGPTTVVIKEGTFTTVLYGHDMKLTYITIAIYHMPKTSHSLMCVVVNNIILGNDLVVFNEVQSLK